MEKKIENNYEISKKLDNIINTNGVVSYLQNMWNYRKRNGWM